MSVEYLLIFYACFLKYVRPADKALVFSFNFSKEETIDI